MAQYNYKAMDASGKTKKGSIEAQSVDLAKERLRKEGLSIMEIDENKDIQINFGRKKVKTRDLAVFCKQFGSILRAGVPIIQALDMLAEQMENKTLQTALKEAQTHVQKGGTLADAFKLNPEIFPPILYNMVAAGEMSGKLEVCFERLATQFEKDGYIQAKIKSAMTYPIVVLVVIGVVVAIMMIKVIPTFSDMFEEMGTKLPGATQMLVNFSNFLVHKWWLPLFIILGIVIGIKFFKVTPTGQQFFGSLALKMPVFGNLSIKTAAATFARTFSTLLASGISLIDAVDQTAKVMKNKVIRDKLMECKSQVAKGVPLSKPIKDMDIFPIMLPQMMHIGEETGNIEDMMVKVADYYEEEVDLAVESLSAAMEPLIMVVLAGVVGVIVVAIYSPIMSMYDAVDSY
ncbi:type IV pilus assembly protein PilC [Eubacterium ruminantium]|uniref:Type IV pilus assembly protein PilC n=1 Tax=Eubacterium ruminantium TaxID=42322 RepID=A0A1T4MJ36_9FIRM|nr:type II secretion system F family protein [Eubacterium ruminantium]SCW48487.1 type IV pilus assembly protein PilC [Eubacterium ruminantium]SDM57637.1 type IV pilus assembly protein PilC [Eubacterium ruminantium]SJZ67049.1 type IV pilus assembly protein PilC [Eubacterium ruminantium]